MFNATEFWKKRFSLFISEMRRYLRLMFNDHLKFVLIFAIGVGAYYYQQWIAQLPDTFPVVFIIAVVMGALLTHSPVRTLLKEADLVFLLPLEEQLQPYFQKAKQFSLVVQCYVLLMVAALFAPLYFHLNDITILVYVVMTIALFVVKGWNIYASWEMRYFSTSTTHLSDMLVRFAVNVVFVYFLFAQTSIIFPSVIVLIMIGLLLYYRRLNTERKVLNWEKLIEIEQERMMSFYRIANLFTDVPKYKEKIKHRAYFNVILNLISFRQSSTYTHLYAKTLIRSSDYLGVYIRLLVIGGAIIYALPYEYGKLIVFVITLYLSGFQLLPLWRHHVMKRWLDLYPISHSVRTRSFLNIMFVMLIVKVVLLTIVVGLSSSFMITSIVLAVGVLFSYAFVFIYTKGRLKKI
ncbi:ABC transporter permease [Bacillus solimangrovi]|uniref:ABC transporter permease n=1 Tax=Bacillus solimangrovi TaxID=1305675 RepID=A0A1E5LE84_9BACI|nr:ABC transporter permease [Bacillus solimangrovi]OEH92398.1 ABC transporter permease [Bacillus solimangrovi]